MLQMVCDRWTCVFTKDSPSAFPTAAVNIEYNSSSATAKNSFHGTYAAAVKEIILSLTKLLLPSIGGFSAVNVTMYLQQPRKHKVRLSHHYFKNC